MKTQVKVYADVCALCRPFDDQRSLRVRMETDAYFLILQHVRAGRLLLVASPVHHVEIEAISDPCEREALLALLRTYAIPVQGNQSAIRCRAVELVEGGLGLADAAHVAYAEATADVFLSVDDRLLKKARRLDISIDVWSPVHFCLMKDLT